MLEVLLSPVEKFLNTMSRLDEGLDHDPEVCEKCWTRRIYAQVARDMLDQGFDDMGVIKWSAETDRLYAESKFHKLWVEETLAGRDPRESFEARGGIT